MLLDDAVEPRGDILQRFAPPRVPPEDARLQQTPVEAEGLAESRSFGAQSPVIRRVPGIAADDGAVRSKPAGSRATRVRHRQNPAAHPAVGAGGTHRSARAALRQGRDGHALAAEGRAEQQLFAQRTDAACFGHQLDVPGTVAGVAIEHRAAHPVIFEHEALIDAALGIAEHQRLAARRILQIAGGKNLDAGHLELRDRQRAGEAGQSDLREMAGTHPRLFPQGSHQAIGAVAMLHALAHRVDARVVGEHGVIDQHAAFAAQARELRKGDVRPYPGRHDHELGRQLAAVGEAHAGDAGAPARP